MDIKSNHELDIDKKFSQSEISENDKKKTYYYVENIMQKPSEEDEQYTVYTISKAKSLAEIKAQIMLMEAFAEKDTINLQGYIDTNLNLGFLYKKGLKYYSTINLKEKNLVEKNKEKSDYYFTKARDVIFKFRGILKSSYAGHPKLATSTYGTEALYTLQLQLAYIYHLGLGVERNLNYSEKLYKQLLENTLLDDPQNKLWMDGELQEDSINFLINNLDLESLGVDKLNSCLSTMNSHIPCYDFFSNEFTYIFIRCPQRGNYYNKWMKTKKFLRQLSNSFTEQREILETSFSIGNTEAFVILGHLYKTGVLFDKSLINKYHKPARDFEVSIPKSNYCFEQIFKFSESVLTSTKDIDILFKYYSTFLEIFKQENNNHIELLNKTFDKINSYYFDESNFHNTDSEHEDQESRMDSFRSLYYSIYPLEKAGKHFKILNDIERLNKIIQIYKNCLERFENDKEDGYEEENQEAINNIKKTLRSLENISLEIDKMEVSNEKNLKHNIKKNEPTESKTKPDDFSKGFSGEELEYINGILMEYFEQHKGWLGGYKPATYHDLAMYLHKRNIEEMRNGSKSRSSIASSVGIKTPPMGIPQELFGYYNQIYSIEQKGFDPLGIDTIIRIKK